MRRLVLLFLLFPLFAHAQVPLFNNYTTPEGLEDASPSFTADGQAMVFARYKDWSKKVPYMAYRAAGKWYQKRLHFVDTLYNLAISPGSTRIVYTTFENHDSSAIQVPYFVDRTLLDWTRPTKLEPLVGMGASYFQIMKDGSLLFYASHPKNGIYTSTPINDTTYSTPQWLSDAVSLPDSDSFDIFMHENRDKLIISQYYNEKKYPDRGAVGLYYYEKIDGTWQRIKRLPLPYTWGGTITADNKFVFVLDGILQYVPLEELDIDW